MKISDPLGKVYTHTMFKRKQQERANKARGGSSRHQHLGSVSDEEDQEEEQKRTRRVENEEDLEELDDDEVLEDDDQSDDSLSTNSSGLAAPTTAAAARGQHGSRRSVRRPISTVRSRSRERNFSAIKIFSPFRQRNILT